MHSKQKINELYGFIKENIYLCDADNNGKEGAFNAALLLGIFSAITNGKILYVGEHGLGKTSLSETISSLIYSLPRGVMKASSIKGSQEITAESIVARPDLGALNNGREEVIWSSFVLTKPKIVDEINRLPPSKQNILLSGMQSDNWNYLNQNMISEQGAWFATMNYEDDGNTKLIPPLLDRFEICAEAKTPNTNTIRLIRRMEEIDIDFPVLTDEYLRNIRENQADTAVMRKRIEDVRNQFSQKMQSEHGIRLLDDEDTARMREEIRNINFNKQSHLFLDVIYSELATCQIYGQKRSNEECMEGCHFSKYACNKTHSSISIRTIKNVDKYSKCVAWMTDSKEVLPMHIETILPYVLWHKIALKPEYMETASGERADPKQLHATKKLVSEIAGRYRKIKSHQQNVVDLILNDETENAREAAGKLDHPVFKEYTK